MNMIRRFVGVALIFFGQIAVWGGRTLFRLGLAVMGANAEKVRQRGSVSPTARLVPYTVETKDGHLVTLYGIRR